MMRPPPNAEWTCEECGAQQVGIGRPWGSHYSFCGFFSAQAYLDDQRADNVAWAEDQAFITPNDFEEPDALPY